MIDLSLQKRRAHHGTLGSRRGGGEKRKFRIVFIGILALIPLSLHVKRLEGLPNIPAMDASDSYVVTLTDNPFCNSLMGALAQGPNNRTMMHAFVSNSGHFPFLHNVLLSMLRNGMPWKPLILSIGAGVCPMLANITELHGRYLCIPYLDRLLDQLQWDEPESIEQIHSHLIQQQQQSNTTTTYVDNNNDEQFHTIDNSFYGWGSVEHKFLINAKLYALRDILECGADAFITDTDIGFRQDPRPYFASITGPEGDIVAQNDTNDSYQLSLNSGFMYWKRTSQNLDLINDIITVPPFWHVDQARVNARMHNRSTPHTLLDAFNFPNGNMLNNFFHRLDDIVVFHANFNDKQYQKEEMLSKAGLWFLNATEADHR
ncbi:hypothetical protein ACHAXR_002897 [Thalassiosira sp. AJA248-18]